MRGWKSLSSFLKEAPEDIVSVRGRGGERRNLKPTTPTPSEPSARELMDTAVQNAQQEAPVKVSYQDPWDSKPIKRPPVNTEKDLDDNKSSGLRASRKSIVNPEIANIFRGNDFIRNRYYENEGFADAFDNDERFREHFRYKNNNNIPDTKGEVVAEIPGDLRRYNEILRELKSGKRQPQSQGGRNYIGYGDQRRPVEWHEDYGMGNRRHNLESYDRSNNINRRYTLDGFAMLTDQEKIKRQQTGRQFDFNDPDVFEDYYKSIARILRGVDTNDIGFDDAELIEEHIHNLMNGPLETKKGDLPINPETGRTKWSELDDYQKGNSWNKSLKEGAKKSRFIHEIPDK